AVAGAGHFADGERRGFCPALEGAHERPARLGLPIGRRRGQAKRAHERLDGLLEGAGVDAAPTELVVAPPEAAVDLLAALGPQRLVVHALEQTLRALERAQRLALARLLYRADRPPGELADLAGGGSRKALAAPPGPR